MTSARTELSRAQPAAKVDVGSRGCERGSFSRSLTNAGH